MAVVGAEELPKVPVVGAEELAVVAEELAVVAVGDEELAVVAVVGGGPAWF